MIHAWCLVALQEVVAYRAAKLFPCDGSPAIDHGVLVIEDGKIRAIGRSDSVELPAQARVVDLGAAWLSPGLHEPHCHIAGALSELNDMVYLTNPELRTLDVVEPENPRLRDALAGGVTTALLIPGSGTNMGGFGTLVKTSGASVDASVVRFPGSLKVAQAGNPEVYSWGVGRALMNWNTRHTLERGLRWARAYAAGEAAFDVDLAGFVGLADGSVPVSVHTQIYQVVLNTVTMLGRDLKLKTFIDHGEFDGYKTGPLAVEYGVAAMIGPRSLWFDRSRAKIFGLTAVWAPYVKDGLVLGYNTDSPVEPQEELSYQATLGVRLGHDDPLAALDGVTSNPAKALLCDQVSGRLAPGLDADFVAWTGFPLDPRSAVTRVWIRGELVYDAERDGRRF